jgi:hypothetical protein
VTIPIERRLVSAQLRPLLMEYLEQGIDGEELALFDRLLVHLANGDPYVSSDALNHLLLGLARQSPPQEIMVRLYAEGRADLVGVKNGQFGWAPSMSALEED